MAVETVEDFWTSAAISDQLLIELSEKETTLSNALYERLTKRETYDSNNHYNRVYKYPVEAKYRVTFSIWICNLDESESEWFPPFRVDPRDISRRLKEELHPDKIDESTRDRIVKDAIFRIVRAYNKLLFFEHIRPNAPKFTWRFEEFDFC
jgi:hypothetical protein